MFKNKIVKRASIVIAVLALIALAVVGLMKWRPLSGGGQVLNPSTPSSDSQGPKRNTANYLVVGIDENNLTDTIIIVCCDFDKDTVKLLTVPRDTYVDEEQVKHEKINSIYSSAKYPYEDRPDIRNLAYCLTNMTGLELDSYVMITIDGFKKAVDLMGGVPVDVPRNMYDAENGSLLLAKGEQVLTGAQAELFVRFRSGYLRGDLGRTEAQKAFLAAAMRQAQTLSLTKLSKLALEILPEVKTDLSVEEILSLASFGKGIEMSSVEAFTIPGAQFNTDRGRACYCVNEEELVKLLNAEFYEKDEQIKASDLRVPTYEGVDFSETYGGVGTNFGE